MMLALITKNRFFLLLSVAILAVSCGSNQDKNSSSGKSQSDNSSSTVSAPANSCACSNADATRLANTFVRNFDQIQNELPSDVARVIRIDGVDARDNCTWVVTFKISWPFGNTDGAHPDEYIKKRYACDGKEVYEQ